MHVFLAALHANHVHESDQDIRAPCMNLIPHSIHIIYTFMPDHGRSIPYIPNPHLPNKAVMLGMISGSANDRAIARCNGPQVQ